MKISRSEKNSAGIYREYKTPLSFIRDLDLMLDDIAVDYARIFTKRLNYPHTAKWFVFDKNWLVNSTM
ncbi:g359 [Yersinia phage phiR1-37]|uniref:hypothetical protein n=1 Tax=Yersinia phage phiR1-37 TaxID=331278 RepID=UPI00022DBE12|nr:hypothetical protein phiR1-37_gp359 [Yersinia phage phiR1-37]CCE26382.1 g359 [Yersinia phage phiR1-37]